MIERFINFLYLLYTFNLTFPICYFIDFQRHASACVSQGNDFGQITGVDSLCWLCAPDYLSGFFTTGAETRLCCPFYLPACIYAGRAILLLYFTFYCGPCVLLLSVFLTLSLIYFYFVFLLVNCIHALHCTGLVYFNDPIFFSNFCPYAFLTCLQ